MSDRKQIAPSELILNSDGSIYHLNLLPEDISEIIINVGDPDRVSLVSSFFDEIELKKQNREFVTHTGYYNQKRITVLSTGIGADNIDIVYNELDALVNIDLKSRMINTVKKKLNLFRIGTSGSLQSSIAVDSFVCSSFGLGLDGLLNHYKFKSGENEQVLLEKIKEIFDSEQNLATPYLFPSQGDIIKEFKTVMQSGITASCQGFYGPQGRTLRLQPAMSNLIEQLTTFKHENHRILNFEMETSAMYGLANLLGHNCCSINLIVANRITNEFSSDPLNPMKQMIELVLDIITQKNKGSN